MKSRTYILNFLLLIFLISNTYAEKNSLNSRRDNLNKIGRSFFFSDDLQLEPNRIRNTYEENRANAEIYHESMANTIFLRFAKRENKNINRLNIERDFNEIYNNNLIVTTSTGHSPLYPIVALHQEELLDILLDKYPDLCIQKIDEFGNTLFHYIVSLDWSDGLIRAINAITARFGRNKIVEILNIKNGINDSSKYTVTEVAYALGREDILKILSNIDTYFFNSHTRQKRIQNVIIANKLDKNRNKLHRTFLGFDTAIISILGQDIDTLEWLTKNRRGYCYEDVDDYNNTLLHIMALCGYREGINLLFRKKIFGLQNKKNALGDTPGCIVASSLQSANCLQDIMKMPKTKINTLDRNNNTVMHALFKSKKLLKGKQYLENFIKKEKPLHSLLDSGLSMVKDGNGESLLHYASKNALGELIKLLSTCKNIPTKLTNCDGKTAIDVYGSNVTDRQNIQGLEQTKKFLANLYKSHIGTRTKSRTRTY